MSSTSSTRNTRSATAPGSASAHRSSDLAAASFSGCLSRFLRSCKRSCPLRRQKMGGVCPCDPDTDPVHHGCSRHGPRNEIALANVTSQLRQEVPVVPVLDPFPDHLHVELVCHLKARIANRSARPIGGRPVDEAAVHLELVERQVAQLCQGGVTRTEIVDRQAETLE